jgi:PTS system nitrogen regulatory IIA component
MKIGELLPRGAIRSELHGQTKIEILKELTDLLGEQKGNIGIDKIVEVLLEREKLGSTGIGDGVAIPHGKLPGISNVLLSFGRSASGISFDSLDEKPATLFFLLVAPENSAGIHLKVLARISRLLKDPSFRERLMKAKDADELYRTIVTEDEKY